jgi:nitrogen fixation protein NifU and related proteins
MGDLSQLYQSVILDHCKTPRNCRRMEQPDGEADGYNPLCGDQLTVWLKMDGDQISDISFEGSGCAISKASASLMTLAVKGKSQAEVARLFQAFHALVTTGPDPVPGAAPLGKLNVFSGVSEFPSRVKCASLSWHTLNSALEKAGATPVNRTDPSQENG